jgi:putative membrane protein
MRWTGWCAAACVAALTVACDTNDRADRYDDSTAAITDNESADRNDLGDPAAVGTSGQAARGNDVNAASFTTQAMIANKAEVKLGELAAQKAQNADVKAFAQMMVKDHTTGLNTLKEAVKGQGVEEPAQLDTKHQALYDRLSKLSGAEFDREYMMAMVDGHREVKNMLETRANRTPTTTGTSGRVADDSRLDSAVNQWAGKTLPVVTKHLERAEQISGRLK